MSVFQQRYLHLVVFTTGMTILAVELSASRLTGPVFGTGHIVWANIIGLTLFYLAVGYFLGGWLADRQPKLETLYRLILWGGATVGLIPVLALVLVPRLSGLAVGWGTFVVMLLIFSVPTILLSTASPFAIRLVMGQAEQAGRRSGRMYAVSTVGSILGTFLPSLLLLPVLGTRLTFVFFAALVTLVALIGYANVQRGRAWRFAWIPAGLILLGVMFA